MFHTMKEDGLTRICSKCGEERLTEEFYTRKSDGQKYPRCIYCMRQEKRESYARTRKVPDRLYLNETTGRLMEHRQYSTRIHWSEPMIQKLRRLFPTTKNEDIAIELGVSVRTLIRQARALGLMKSPEWMAQHSRQNCRIMRILNKCRGNSGMFKKGVRNSPATEFKKKTTT